MTVLDFVLALSGLVLTALGFVLAVSEPVQDWKFLYGFCLLMVGVLCLIFTIL